MTRYLIDTHVFLWAAASPEKLSAGARRAIQSAASDVFLSAAAVWELTIKFGLGKVTLPMEPAIFVPSRLDHLGIRALQITHDHALAVAALPNIHRDPFDRMMIAQAQAESLIFITADPYSLRYPVKTLKAA